MFAEGNSVVTLSLAIVLAVTVLFALTSVVFLCNYCLVHRTRQEILNRFKDKDERRRNKQRLKEEDKERERIISTVEAYIRKDGNYKKTKILRNLGSRLQKYWIELKLKDSTEATHILTATPFSKNYSFNDDSKAANIERLVGLFKELNKHRYIQDVEHFALIDDGSVVVIIQKLVPEGSLRDKIHNYIKNGDYNVSWSEKINEAGAASLNTEDIKTYAEHILEAMIFLKKAGFLHLGHIHSGNIFIVDGKCHVGGHDNTLLGYRADLYSDVAQSGYPINSMGTIMFGRVIFEMCTGREPDELFPTNEEIDSISDPKAKKFLIYIFNRTSTTLSHSLDQIYQHKFFEPANSKWYKRNPRRDPLKDVDVTITEDMRDMLKKTKP